MKKNRKAFTLIELLAVIIILGVLMLIAIPSVTEYINNSRKSTFLSSASNFISSVTVKTNAGADGGFNFTNPSLAYYVPVSNEAEHSCVSIEKGGKSPFGTWKNTTDNNEGFAYVIVLLNSTGTSYSYYFTARDSAGYGIVPKQEGSWDKSLVLPNATVPRPDNGAAAFFEGRDASVLLTPNASDPSNGKPACMPY